MMPTLPEEWRCQVLREDVRLPKLVGIVNITEDSFSDGGRYLTAHDALAWAHRLRTDGADVIELGPAASHPGSVAVSAAEEQRRLVPVIESLVAQGIPVAVDSWLTSTQRFVIEHGATYLNDIQGFPDQDVYHDLAASECRLIVMHSIQRRGPATMVETDPAAIWTSIEGFFADRLAALEAAGIKRERLIVDPGLGYFLGTNPEPSLIALAGIRHLKDRFGTAVMVSPSRKSFLRTLTGRDISRTGPSTLAAELYAAWQGADYIRTHDVAAIRDALAVLNALAEHS